MLTKKYLEQVEQWPSSGRHIMANFDKYTITVYQAYRTNIAEHAVEHQKFGGEFSYSRMSWIKPNFLWMMFRSGWASKEGQEHILAIKLRRDFFNEILCNVVPSTFDAVLYRSKDNWQQAVSRSDIRLQWDPDHGPLGEPIERRALQIGLRGEYLRRYGQQEIVSISDITSFVCEQRSNAFANIENLTIPEESPYPIEQQAAEALGIR